MVKSAISELFPLLFHAYLLVIIATIGNNLAISLIIIGSYLLPSNRLPHIVGSKISTTSNKILNLLAPPLAEARATNKAAATIKHFIFYFFKLSSVSSDQISDCSLNVQILSKAASYIP